MKTVYVLFCVPDDQGYDGAPIFCGVYDSLNLAVKDRDAIHATDTENDYWLEATRLNVAARPSAVTKPSTTFGRV